MVLLNLCPPTLSLRACSVFGSLLDGGMRGRGGCVEEDEAFNNDLPTYEVSHLSEGAKRYRVMCVSMCVCVCDLPVKSEGLGAQPGLTAHTSCVRIYSFGGYMTTTSTTQPEDDMKLKAGEEEESKNKVKLCV